jgi:hypothetical protein
MNRETREQWDTLVTLARAAQRTNGSMWEGKLAEFARAIQAADNELASKNRVLKETAWRLRALLVRGDLSSDPSDEAITQAWLRRVYDALRSSTKRPAGTSTRRPDRTGTRGSESA